MFLDVKAKISGLLKKDNPENQQQTKLTPDKGGFLRRNQSQSERGQKKRFIQEFQSFTKPFPTS